MAATEQSRTLIWAHRSIGFKFLKILEINWAKIFLNSCAMTHTLRNRKESLSNSDLESKGFLRLVGKYSLFLSVNQNKEGNLAAEARWNLQTKSWDYSWVTLRFVNSKRYEFSIMWGFAWQQHLIPVCSCLKTLRSIKYISLIAYFFKLRILAVCPPNMVKRCCSVIFRPDNLIT